VAVAAATAAPVAARVVLVAPVAATRRLAARRLGRRRGRGRGGGGRAGRRRPLGLRRRRPVRTAVAGPAPDRTRLGFGRAAAERVLLGGEVGGVVAGRLRRADRAAAVAAAVR